MRGADDPGAAGAGVQLHDLVSAVRPGADADDPLAVRGEGGCELGPGPRGVDDLAGLGVEDAEDGGAPAVQDRDQAVVQGREPALPELPQRPAELLLADAQGLPVAVEVPPAGAVGGVQQGAVRCPVRLGDGLLGAAGDGPGVPERVLGADVGDDQLGAVPGHARVVPGEPGGAAAVGREAGSGDEAVPFGGEFAHRAPVVGRGAVQRHGHEDAADVGGPLAGELLQDAPHLAALGTRVRLDPAQSAAHRGQRCQRARLGAAGGEGVQPLVGEVHEDHQRTGAGRGRAPGPAAVLDDAAAHVPRCGQHRFLGAVGVPPHQGAPPALGGPGRGPPHLVTDEGDVVGPSVVRGGEGRVDRRGPRSVRQSRH
ncbi:hypothetical protein RKD48_001373 [Streptomyces ambofaciens]